LSQTSKASNFAQSELESAKVSQFKTLYLQYLRQDVVSNCFTIILTVVT